MRIIVLPGDGIGPEITDATVMVLEELDRLAGLGLSIEHEDVGLESLKKHGTTLTDAARRRAEAASGIILGPLSTYQYPPREGGGLNPSHEFRIGLDLFSNIRPSVTRPREKDGIDIILVRENTEGFYACRSMHKGGGEFMPDPDTAFALRRITRSASRRVAKTAFDLASRRRRKVTVIHKANVFKLSDALFLEAVGEVARDYVDIECEEMLVDAAAALLIRDPTRFDVVLTTNMFGDILSNEAAELAGGLGLAASLNAGSKHAMAQAAHGSAPDIAGSNRANPTGLMLSAAMLLEWLGPRHDRPDIGHAGHWFARAVDRALSGPATRTADLGGSLDTRSFGRAVAQFLVQCRGEP